MYQGKQAFSYVCTVSVLAASVAHQVSFQQAIKSSTRALH